MRQQRGTRIKTGTGGSLKLPEGQGQGMARGEQKGSIQQDSGAVVLVANSRGPVLLMDSVCVY